MDIQKITDDVEVQGTEYKETSVVEDGNEDVEDSEAPVQRGRRQQRGSQSGGGRSRSERSSDSNSKNIIIIAGAALGVLVIIILAAVYFKTQKGKVADTDDYGDVSEFMVDENSPLYQAAMDAEQNANRGNGDANNQGSGESYSISYSDDEVARLREAGYTGPEIEEFASQGLRVDAKVAEAKAEQRRFYEENLADYLDGKSEKYKELETYTWLGQDELVYDANDISNWKNKETVKNCDYVKVPARGFQTFLRVEINDGLYAFMLVRPERYQELPQTGNIVVYMKYYTTGHTSIIYQIEEKDIS